MKVDTKTDYTANINLPQKTITVEGNLTKKEAYFLQKMQDTKRYTETIEENKDSNLNYNLMEIPMHVEKSMDPTDVINNVLKDIIIRYQILNSHLVSHKLGFIDKEEVVDVKNYNEKSNELSKIQKNQTEKVENFAKKNINQINSLGTFLNYNNFNYITNRGDVQFDIVDEFWKLYQTKEVYQITKPVHWCTKCKKSLEKKDLIFRKNKVNNYYIKINVKNDLGFFSDYDNLRDVYFLASTIRPWVLDSCEYIALAKDQEYSIVEVREKDKNVYYIMLSEMVDEVMQAGFFLRYEVKEKYKAEDFVKLQLENPIDEEKIFNTLYVSKEKVLTYGKDSTGLVFVSNNNTYLDYEIYKDANIENKKVFLDQKGYTLLNNEKNPQMYYKDLETKIIKSLKSKNKIFVANPSIVKLPQCRECNDHTIYRNVSEWYVKRSKEKTETVMNEMRQVLNKLNCFKVQEDTKTSENIEYKKRREEYESILKKIESKNPVQISSEDFFGVPIPAFYCAECGEEIVNEKEIGLVSNFLKDKGLEAWFKQTPEQILNYEVACDKCGCTFLFKETRVLNNFFKYMCSPFVPKNEEGKENINICIESEEDFFYKLFALSFKSDSVEQISSIDRLFLHSVVNENTKKLKADSLFVDTNDLLVKGIGITDIVKKYGTDTLRLWTIYKLRHQTINLKESDIERLDITYKDIRNVLKYLTSNLVGFNPTMHYIKVDERADLDKYYYEKIYKFYKNMTNIFESCSFDKMYYTLEDFLTNVLLKSYFDIVKYRLYVLNTDDFKRRSVQSNLYDTLMCLVLFLEPLIPFTCEEITPFIWHTDQRVQKNILMLRCKLEKLNIDEQQFTKVKWKWDKILAFKNKTKKILAKAQQDKIIGNTLEAKVIINTTEKNRIFLLRNYDDVIRSLNVSQLEINVSGEKGATVQKAEGVPCARCKNYSEEIGMELKYRNLCPLCAELQANTKVKTSLL